MFKTIKNRLAQHMTLVARLNRAYLTGNITEREYLDKVRASLIWAWTGYKKREPLGVQIVILLDPNSSDPYQVLGVLPEVRGLDHFQLTQRAIDFVVADFQEMHDRYPLEEGCEHRQYTAADLMENGYGVQTFVMPITKGGK